MEGLLNYAYYQAGALNQFDQIGHLLHFTLYDVHTGPCGNFSTGHDPQHRQAGCPGRGRRHDHQHQRTARLRRLARPEPARASTRTSACRRTTRRCPNGTIPHAAAQRLRPERHEEHDGARPAPRAGGAGAERAGTAAGRRPRRRRPAAAATAAARLQRGRAPGTSGRAARRHPRPDPRPAAATRSTTCRRSSRTSWRRTAAEAAAVAPAAGGQRGAADDLLNFLS